MGRTAAPPATDDPPRVLDELACEGCGYTLRGLARDARCPECNAPVAESLHDDRLADIPVARLARLRRSMRVAELGSLALLAGLATQMTISPLVALLTRLGMDPDVQRWLGIAVRMGGRLAIVGGLGSIAAAALMLSHLGPRDAGRPDQVRLARIVRGGMLAGALLIGQAVAIPMLGGPGGRAGSTMAMVVQLGGIAGVVCLGGVWWGLLRRIAWLDDRSGEGGGTVDLRGLARGVLSIVVAIGCMLGGRIILLSGGVGPGWVPGTLRGIAILVALATIPMLLGTAGASIALRRRIDLLLIIRHERDAEIVAAPSTAEAPRP
jgi:hypothetical protein